MTKFLLNGGNLKSYPEKIPKMVEELFRGMDGEVRELWCFFATSRDEEDITYQRYVDHFRQFYPTELQVISLQAVRESFVEQVEAADIIHLMGGSTVKLYDELSTFDLATLLEDKVVEGSSAGSNVLGSSYWSPGLRKLGNGFGLLDIKFLSHFQSNYGYDDPRGPIDWEAAKAELATYGDPAHEVLALEEGEFRVFER